MNNKISFPELAAALSNASGESRKSCEDFIKELFNQITIALTDGQSVRIKGLGTFKLTDIEPRRSINVSTGEEFEIPGHSRVVFTPAKELAERINAPFEAFDPVELSDDMDEAELILDDEQDNAIHQEPSIDETEVEEDTISVDDHAISDKPAAVMDSDTLSVAPDSDTSLIYPEVEDETRAEAAPVDTPVIITEAEEKPSSEVYPGNTMGTDNAIAIHDDSKRSSHRFLWGFAAGILSTICAAALIFAILINKGVIDKTPSETSVEPAATATAKMATDNKPDIQETQQPEISLDSLEMPEPPATAPSDPTPKASNSTSGVIAEDMITKTRYLTTMAKEHYGSYHLWPYIYEENKAFLGHPDRIRPGTKVKIPDLAKYGVDPANKADIEKAKRMGAEIYARYNK